MTELFAGCPVVSLRLEAFLRLARERELARVLLRLAAGQSGPRSTRAARGAVALRLDLGLLRAPLRNESLLVDPRLLPAGPALAARGAWNERIIADHLLRVLRRDAAHGVEPVQDVVEALWRRG